MASSLCCHSTAKLSQQWPWPPPAARRPAHSSLLSPVSCLDGMHTRLRLALVVFILSAVWGGVGASTTSVVGLSPVGSASTPDATTGSAAVVTVSNKVVIGASLSGDGHLITGGLYTCPKAFPAQGTSMVNCSGTWDVSGAGFGDGVFVAVVEAGPRLFYIESASSIVRVISLSVDDHGRVDETGPVFVVPGLSSHAASGVFDSVSSRLVLSSFNLTQGSQSNANALVVLVCHVSLAGLVGPCRSNDAGGGREITTASQTPPSLAILGGGTVVAGSVVALTSPGSQASAAWLFSCILGNATTPSSGDTQSSPDVLWASLSASCGAVSFYPAQAHAIDLVPLVASPTSSAALPGSPPTTTSFLATIAIPNPMVIECTVHSSPGPTCGPPQSFAQPTRTAISASVISTAYTPSNGLLHLGTRDASQSKVVLCSRHVPSGLFRGCVSPAPDHPVFSSIVQLVSDVSTGKLWMVAFTMDSHVLWMLFPSPISPTASTLAWSSPRLPEGAVVGTTAELVFTPRNASGSTLPSSYPLEYDVDVSVNIDDSSDPAQAHPLTPHSAFPSLVYSVAFPTFSKYTVESSVVGIGAGSLVADLRLDAGSSFVADADALTSLPLGSTDFVLHLCSASGALFQVAPSFDYAEAAPFVRVTLGSDALHLSPLPTGRSTVSFTLSSSTPAQKYLSITIHGANIPGSPFAVSFSSACPPGSFVFGSQCRACPANSWSSTFDAPTCSPCPPHTHAPPSSTNVTDCTCDQDTYRLHEATGLPCFPCPEGAICAGNTTAPVAAPGFYSSSSPIDFISCSHDRHSALARCLGEDRCGAVFAERLCAGCAPAHYAAGPTCSRCHVDGSAAAVSETVAIVLVLFLLIWLLLSAPAAHTPPVHDAHAADPSTRLTLCALAVLLWREALIMLVEVVGLVLLAQFGIGESFEVVVLALALALLTLYLGLSRVVAVYFTRNGQCAPASGLQTGVRERLLGAHLGGTHGDDDVHHTHNHDGHVLGIESIVKSLVIYIQTLVAVLSIGDVEWGALVEGLMEATERVNLRLAGLECAGLSVVEQLYVKLSLFPIVAVLTLVAAGFTAAVRPLLRPLLYSRVGHILIGAAFFFIYPVFVICLDVFACVPEDIPHPHAFYLASAPWIQCWTSPHYHMVGAASTGIVATTAAAAFVAALVARASPVTLVLRHTYVAAAWWFEGFITLRRIAVAAAIALGGPHTSFTAPLLVFIILASLVTTLVTKPFVSLTAHALEVATHIVLLVTLALVQAAGETGNDGSVLAYALTIVVLNTGVVLVAASALTIPLFRTAIGVVRDLQAPTPASSLQ